LVRSAIADFWRLITDMPRFLGTRGQAPMHPLSMRRGHHPLSVAYLNRGLGSNVGGERLCRFVAAVGPVVPRAPGLIWVLGVGAGDVMVDGSIRVERLRPLGLWWTAARGRESRQLRERAGRVAVV
jgi:hypothetical protein